MAKKNTFEEGLVLALLDIEEQARAEARAHLINSLSLEELHGSSKVETVRADARTDWDNAPEAYEAWNS